ncbi:MAG: tetratricopeptide repeat protein, partial [Planctomycetota bacterium]|nr:tetratricopeptide repeat protein [Planctomycetota bacterium]
PSDRYTDANDALLDFSRRLGEDEQAPGHHEVFGSLLAGRFVGRERLMEELRGLMPNSDDPGKASVLTLEGPPGIGKSRLVHEIKIHAQFRDVPFLHAGCNQEGEVGTRCFERITREALTLCQSGDAERLIKTYKSSFRALFPSLVGDTQNFSTQSRIQPESPQKHLDQVARCLIDIAETIPYVIAIEDIQWIDETSLGLLSALIRNMTASTEATVKPQLLLTHRMERKRDLTTVEALLTAYPHWKKLTVPFLNAQQCTDLIGSMLALKNPPTELGERIRGATLGNPFFIEETVKGLLEEGLLRMRLGLAEGLTLEELPVSSTLSEVIGDRLARIPETPRRVIETLAIHGAPTGLRLLSATCCLPPEEVLNGFQHLRQRGMLRETRSDNQLTEYSLLHRQIGDTVLRSLSPQQLKALHSMAGMALEECYPEALERIIYLEPLARHFDNAGLARKAFFYHHKAGEQAISQHRNEDAVQHLRRALELLRAGAGALRDERRGEAALLGPLGLVLSLIGRFADAVRVFKDLIELGAEATGLAIHLRGLRLLAMVELKRGEFEAAVKMLRRALGLATEETARERGRALVTMARIALWRGDYLSASALAQEALSIKDCGETLKDHQSGTKILALAEYNLGRFSRATRHVKKSLELFIQRSPKDHDPIEKELQSSMSITPEQALAELADNQAIATPFGDGFGMIISFTEMGLYLNIRGSIEACLEHCEESRHVYERLGDKQRLATTLNNAGVYYRLGGQAALSLERLERSLNIIAGIDDSHGEGVSLINLALLKLSLGDLDGAYRFAERVLKIAHDYGISWLKGHCYRTLGRIYMARGELEPSDRQLQRAEGVFRMLRHARNLSDVLIDRAELALMGEELDKAREQLKRLQETGIEFHGQDQRCRMLLLEGALEISQERPEDATRHFEDALDCARASKVMELEGQVHDRLGSLHRSLSALWLAQNHFEQAREIDEFIAQDLPPDLALCYAKHKGLNAFRQETREVQLQLDDD